MTPRQAKRNFILTTDAKTEEGDFVRRFFHKGQVVRPHDPDFKHPYVQDNTVPFEDDVEVQPIVNPEAKAAAKKNLAHMAEAHEAIGQRPVPGIAATAKEVAQPVDPPKAKRR